MPQGGEIHAITYNPKQPRDNPGFDDNNDADGSVVININNNNSSSSQSKPSGPPPPYQTPAYGIASSSPNGRGLERKASIAVSSTLSAHNIDFTVKIKKKIYKPAEDKKILHNVTGVFRQGMNAILGPTGCGKSTFLDVLAGRVEEDNVKGTLLLDSKPTPKNFKCMVGYVVQDDVVVGTLTVRENFAFSAALRLPETVSAAEKKHRVDDVIKELGLTTCADTKVGNELIRGVSGGERKRCNIGMELIIRPPVLFLDEPTTGLDANTASTVLMFLKRLSDRGRTIIFSIHQPRYSIYRLFDSVMLLSAGHTIFHGPAHQALEFFKQEGYVCQEHNNPPDFFLDVINGDPSTLASDGDVSSNGRGGANTANGYHGNQVDLAKSKHDALVQGFAKSTWNQSLVEDASAIYTDYKQLHEGNERDKIEYATSFLTQVSVLSKRTIKNIIRNPQIGLATFMTVLFFSALVSAIYYDISDNPFTAINDRKGALFFIIMNQVMINMAAVEVFINERKYFLHENVTGFYRVSVYFFVKIFCDIFPLRLLPVVLQSSIVYFAIGFRSGAAEFFKFVLTLCGITSAATGLCFLYSALFKVFSLTQLLLSVTYVVIMLFSGFLVNLENVADWLNWLKHLSFMKYGMESLFIIEFKDRDFCPPQNSTSTVPCAANGNLFLDTSGVDYDEEWYFWQNNIVNFAFAVFFLVLTYVNLRIVKKHR